MVRWLYHVLYAAEPVGDSYRPPSLADEGVVHCSFADTVAASARLYFPAGAELRVLQIDPRRLDCALEICETPRGPMPHVRGAIPRAAIARAWALSELEEIPDQIG